MKSGTQEQAFPIRAEAKVLRPRTTETWCFLRLPQATSDALPSRGLVSVSGSLNGIAFSATLEPDGQGGHWLKVNNALMAQSGIAPGDVVQIELAPVEVEPEPVVPSGLSAALDHMPAAKDVWNSLTPVARRDWIHWMNSAKKEETRLKRMESACDMLAKGKRRPCCFDRSGMYSGSLSCPVANEE